MSTPAAPPPSKAAALARLLWRAAWVRGPCIAALTAHRLGLASAALATAFLLAMAIDARRSEPLAESVKRTLGLTGDGS